MAIAEVRVRLEDGVKSLRILRLILASHPEDLLPADLRDFVSSYSLREELLTACVELQTHVCNSTHAERATHVLVQVTPSPRFLYE